ncbi:hypothetical protein P691DRAFT_675567 [Macrolepiota fuliginosa MF-IS2]|uniref:SHSP domain-containing protein n=1 Tax=Macrolepiota fuliginosa MF-IS2 TaxID=1400762 RepID=A0A9P5X611_9AGAR|nr:hypothetical protein P691DRAFT_675567 [Macrolepiota fuliginosa MF-IS2]
MPAHGYNRKDLNVNTSPGASAVSPSRLPQDKSAFLPPATPAVTGIDYPSRANTSAEQDSRRFHYQPASSTMSSHHYPQTNNRLYSLPNTVGSAIDDKTDPPANTVSLDDVWSAIRQKKERQMAKEKPKVQSLEEVNPELLASGGTQDEGPSVAIPVLESHMSPTKSIKKQKSISTLRESGDGRSIVATYEMPQEVEKQDVHISFQRNRLVVTWVTVEMIECEEEDGVVYRERYERSHHRTIPLPEGTKFEEVQAIMNGRRLSLRYPNMRCLRVEPRSRSGNS